VIFDNRCKLKKTSKLLAAGASPQTWLGELTDQWASPLFGLWAWLWALAQQTILHTVEPGPLRTLLRHWILKILSTAQPFENLQ